MDITGDGFDLDINDRGKVSSYTILDIVLDAQMSVIFLLVIGSYSAEA